MATYITSMRNVTVDGVDHVEIEHSGDRIIHVRETPRTRPHVDALWRALVLKAPLTHEQLALLRHADR